MQFLKKTFKNLTEISKIGKLISRRQTNRRGGLRRVKTSFLLAVIIFAAAAQTLHQHAKLGLFSSSFHSTDNFETLPASAQSLENQDECLICQLKGQYSGIRIFHAPSVVFSPEVKIVRAAVFFTAGFYRSTENSRRGGRAPPLPSLS